jgi:hypothetical protein
MDSMHLLAACPIPLLLLLFTSNRKFRGFFLAIVLLEIKVAPTLLSLVTVYKNDQQMRAYIFIIFYYVLYLYLYHMQL